MNTSRPNVFLFISHDTGQFVEPYGIRTVHTPTMNRLAREGIRFANSFGTSPLCSPSRGSCVTGRYPHQNGLDGLASWDEGRGHELNPDEKHIARLFAENGYESTLCGHVHESANSRALGFDTFLAGNEPRFNGGGNLLHFGDEIAQWLALRDSSRPFYCQVGCGETHAPYRTAKPDRSKGVWAPPWLNDIDEVEESCAKLQGSVARLDQGIGNIIDAFEQAHVLDNTIVIVTTDHGIDLPRAKGTLYDKGIETFLFIRYPGGEWGRARTVEELASNIDILPTLCDACGIQTPDNVAGQSFLPLLKRKASYKARDAIFAEKTFHNIYDPQRAIRTEKWKYIRYFEEQLMEDLRLATMTQRHWWKERWVRTDVEQLFDCENDPLEMHNLAKDPACQNILLDMRTRLYTWMVETSDPLLDGPVESRAFRNHRLAFIQSGKTGVSPRSPNT